MALDTLPDLAEDATFTTEQPIKITYHEFHLRGSREACYAPTCSGLASRDVWASQSINGARHERYRQLCITCYRSRVEELMNLTDEEERVVIKQEG